MFGINSKRDRQHIERQFHGNLLRARNSLIHKNLSKNRKKTSTSVIEEFQPMLRMRRRFQWIVRKCFVHTKWSGQSLYPILKLEQTKTITDFMTGALNLFVQQLVFKLDIWTVCSAKDFDILDAQNIHHGANDWIITQRRCFDLYDGSHHYSFGNEQLVE